MTCEAIQPELVGFQMGLVEADERAAIEEHLLGCTECLREYLAIKRSLETAETEAPASELSRRRLRTAVASELGLETKPRRWWERPVALSLAAASVAAALLIAHGLSVSPGAKPHGFAHGFSGRAVSQARSAAG